MSVEPNSTPLLLFIGLEAKLARLLDVALSRRGYQVAFSPDLESTPTKPNPCVVFLDGKIAGAALRSVRSKFPSNPIAALSERTHDPDISALGTESVVSLSQPLPSLLSETERLLARFPPDRVSRLEDAT